MPLDPSVILPSASILQSIAQPQPVATPFDMQAQALKLQSAKQQAALNTLNYQQQQTELQQHQQVVQAFQNAGGDIDKAIATLNAQGNPQALVIQKNRSEAQKLIDEHTKTVLDNTAHQADMAGRSVSSVIDAPDELKPTVYQAQKQFIEANNLAPEIRLPDTYSADVVPILNTIRDRAQSIKDKADTAKTQTENKKAEAERARVAQLTANEKELQPGAVELQAEKLAQGRAEAAVPGLQQALAAGTYQQARAALPPEVQARFAALGDKPTAAQIRTAGLTQEQQSAEAARQTELGLSGRRTAAEEANALIAGRRETREEQQYGTDMNGGVSPAAQMIADGRMDPATTRAMLRRNPGLINQVVRLDKTFDEANIDKRYDVLKEFNSSANGKAGGQVLALNTLIHHADLYQQAAAALKNGSFRPGNAAYNEVSSLMGSAAPQNAALVAQFLAGETGKLAQGGSPLESELKPMLARLGTSNSPEQIKGAADTLMGIATGRAIPLLEKVKDAHLDNMVHVIGPDAAAILPKFNIDPKTLKHAAIPANVPANAWVQTKQSGETRWSIDGGKTWQTK